MEAVSGGQIEVLLGRYPKYDQSFKLYNLLPLIHLAIGIVSCVVFKKMTRVNKIRDNDKSNQNVVGCSQDWHLPYLLSYEQAEWVPNSPVQTFF